MAISKTFTAETSGQSTLFPADSRARIFQPRGDAPVLTETTPGSGQSTLDLLANYDLNTRSWKTSQLSLFGGLAEFSETWPRSGMLVNGTAYRQADLVPIIDATASGLLPTPMASEGGGGAHTLRHAIDGTFHMTLFRHVAIEHLGRDSLSGQIDFESYDQITGRLNPEWIEWLMGYPLGWTAIED